MKPSRRRGGSLREELRLHSRYIRDTLVPLLANQPRLSYSDSVCLHSILKILDATPITLQLLRYSRIEKALMVIAATGNNSWPMDVVVHAEELVTKWEDKLGPLKNVRADIYGPGGRMEGVKKITWKDGRVPDDETKSAWSVEGTPKPSRAHAIGHLGFEVGDWWLKPAAAYRDGIIDETSHGITANGDGAYAIVLTGSCEMELGKNGDIRYKAAVEDPGAFKLTKTMLRADPDDKVVRVLRSWKLNSKLAPKAGLRYDGLYRILSFSIHLAPPNTWQTAFTLSRVPTQPSLLPALHIPASDQMDDWRDYQRLKLIDRGDDFAVLREILAQPHRSREEVGGGEGLNGDRHGSEDSGYFSRRSSKALSTGGDEMDSTLLEDVGEVVDEKAAEEVAEEFHDEGAGPQKVEQSRYDSKDQMKKEGTASPFPDQTVTSEHVNLLLPQLHIGTRFLSPQRRAEARVSAEEAVFTASR